MRRLLLALGLVLSVSCRPAGIQEILGMLDHLEMNPQLVPPTYEMPGDSAKAKEFIQYLLVFAEKEAIEVDMSLDLRERGLMGRSTFGPHARLVFVSSHLKSNAQLTTLVHELAHSCHTGKIVFETEAELFAETTAALTLGRIGFGGGMFSFRYLLVTAGERKRRYFLEKDEADILACANKLSGAIEDGRRNQKNLQPLSNTQEPSTVLQRDR